MTQFNFARRTFVVRFWPALVCVTVIVVTLAAAQWQTARARYKQGLVDAYEQLQKQPPVDLTEWGAKPPPEFARAAVNGEWRTEVLIYADNEVRDGQAGYGIFMPLCQTETRCVLVNRGWVKQGAARGDMPAVVSPPGRQHVEGVVMPAQPRFVELSAQSVEARVWQNGTVELVAKASGLVLAPFILDQTSKADDGILRDDVRPEFGVEKHIIYMVQWYFFSLVTAVSGVVAAMKKTGEKS